MGQGAQASSGDTYCRSMFTGGGKGLGGKAGREDWNETSAGWAMRTGSVTCSTGSPGGLGARPHQLFRKLPVPWKDNARPGCWAWPRWESSSVLQARCVPTHCTQCFTRICPSLELNRAKAVTKSQALEKHWAKLVGNREKSQLAGSGECLLYFRAQKVLKQSLSKFTKEFCLRPRWKSQRISTKTIGTCETNAWFIKLITKLFITYFCLGVTLHFSSGAKSFVFSITVDFCNTLSFEICFKSTSLDWSKAFGFVLEVSCFQQQVPISKQNCKGNRRQSSPLWEETKQPYTSQVLLIKVCGHLNLVTEFSLCFSCKWRITVSQWSLAGGKAENQSVSSVFPDNFPLTR